MAIGIAADRQRGRCPRQQEVQRLQ
jgi:hypothetical protein